MSDDRRGYWASNAKGGITHWQEATKKEAMLMDHAAKQMQARCVDECEDSVEADEAARRIRNLPANAHPRLPA